MSDTPNADYACPLCRHVGDHDPGCPEAIPADVLARLRNILDYPTTNVTLPKTGDVVKMIHPDLLREAVEALEAAQNDGSGGSDE